jgi:hypothetical protein
MDIEDMIIDMNYLAQQIFQSEKSLSDDDKADIQFTINILTNKLQEK